MVTLSFPLYKFIENKAQDKRNPFKGQYLSISTQLLFVDTSEDSKEHILQFATEDW